MSKKKKKVVIAPKVAVISVELALKLLKILETLAAHDSYETEYDGKMMTVCHSCGWLETYQHKPECEFAEARRLIAEAYGETP